MNNQDINIKVGDKLEIEIPDASEKKPLLSLRSQVMDIIDEQNYIIAAPVYNGHFYNLHQKSVYKIFFTVDDCGLMYFKALVSEHGQLNKMPYFKIQRLDAIRRYQRRSDYRLKCIKDIYYRVIGSNRYEDNAGHKTGYKKGLTKNISGSGMCIVIDEKVAQGQYLEIIFPLEDEKMTVECLVIRSLSKAYGQAEKYETGLSFVDISDKIRYKIIKYIFKQQRLQIFRDKNILKDEDMAAR